MLSFPSQGKLFLILFLNGVQKERLSQSNDHVSYTRGHANLFDKEIAFGTTNWLSLQWSTVIFQDPSVGFRLQTGVVYVIWWGLPPGVFKCGSNICSYPPGCSIFNFLSCWWAGWREVISGPAIWSSHNHISHRQTKNPVWGLCQWPSISIPVTYSGTGKWSPSVSTDLRKSPWARQGPGPHLSPTSHTPHVTGATLTLCSTVLENVWIFPFPSVKLPEQVTMGRSEIGLGQIIADTWRGGLNSPSTRRACAWFKNWLTSKLGKGSWIFIGTMTLSLLTIHPWFL